MTNVIALNIPSHRQSRPQRLADHARLFVQDRRGEDDVFWLKENAEFLNILEATHQPAEAVLEVYEGFYDTVEARLGEYPQYYRFLLSMCLDLEDLGMPGQKGTVLSAWAKAEGLAEAELSDLQRAEAARLLSRRGWRSPDPDLAERLHRFIDRCETFAIPNKKAAYELTHIVFYLSEYGRCDPQLSPRALQSLTYAGLLAYLDQNYDLLSEVCVALRYAGQTPSAIWEDAVLAALSATQAQSCSEVPMIDDYHAYFVCSWLAGLRDGPAFALPIDAGTARFAMAAPPARPLRALSRSISETRNSDWDMVRSRIASDLDDDALQLLAAAERSTHLFSDFYAGFSRVARPML